MKWIRIGIKKEDVLPIAESLMNRDLEREGYVMEHDPHITLIPKFENIERVELPEMEDNQSFSVSGFRYWPDFEDPMVVMLDMTDDMILELWRDELTTQIKKSNIKVDMPPLHITLIKAGDAGDEYDFSIDNRIRNNLLDKCDQLKTPTHVRATDISIDRW